MCSWSLATDSRPLGTRITLTDTKRRWQKHCLRHGLPGLLVSNTAKWIKLPPIKDLTILLSPSALPFILPPESWYKNTFHCSKIQTIVKLCNVCTSIIGMHMWYATVLYLFLCAKKWLYNFYMIMWAIEINSFMCVGEKQPCFSAINMSDLQVVWFWA